MTNNEIFAKLKEMISEQLEIDSNKINKDTEIIKGLGADSLDLVEILMNVEAEWNIVIEDDDVEGLVTIDDVVNLIAKMSE